MKGHITLQQASMPGGCMEEVRAALFSCYQVCTGLDAPAAPLVAALPDKRHDWAACCHSDTLCCIELQRGGRTTACDGLLSLASEISRAHVTAHAMLRTSYVARKRSVIQLEGFEAGGNFDGAQSECQAFCSSAQRWQSCRFQ